MGRVYAQLTSSIAHCSFVLRTRHTTCLIPFLISRYIAVRVRYAKKYRYGIRYDTNVTIREGGFIALLCFSLALDTRYRVLGVRYQVSGAW